MNFTLKIRKNVQYIVFTLFLVVIFFSRWLGQPFLQPDSFTYMAMANALLHGEGYLSEWGRSPLSVPLLYPSLIAAGQSWFGLEAQTAAFSISVLSGIALIFFVFLWAAKRLGWSWAWMTVFLVAFDTSLVSYGLTLLTESLFTLLFFAAAGFSWLLLRKMCHPLWWLGAGILMGLTILTKAVGLVLPVALLIWTIFYVLSGATKIRYALSRSMVLILGILLVTQPVSWKTQIPGGGTEFSNKRSLSALLMRPDLRTDRLERERYTAKLTPEGDQFQVEVGPKMSLSEILIAQRTQIVKQTLLNLGLSIHSLFVLIPWWLLIWIPLGLLVQWYRREIGGLIFAGYLLTISLGLLGFYTVAWAYTTSMGPERYTVPLIPLMAFLTTTGMRLVFQEAERVWKVKRFSFRPLGIGVAFLVLVLALFPAIVWEKKVLFVPEGKRWQESGESILGDWMQRTIGSGQKIMSRDPAIPYYAGGFWVLTPFEPVDRVVGFARRKGVRLMVIRQNVEGSLRPQLAPFLQRDFSYPGLHRVLWIPDRNVPSRHGLVIYELE